MDCAANKGWNKTALLLIENDADVDPRDKANVRIISVGVDFISCLGNAPTTGSSRRASQGG